FPNRLQSPESDLYGSNQINSTANAGATATIESHRLPFAPSRSVDCPSADRTPKNNPAARLLPTKDCPFHRGESYAVPPRRPDCRGPQRSACPQKDKSLYAAHSAADPATADRRRTVQNSNSESHLQIARVPWPAPAHRVERVPRATRSRLCGENVRAGREREQSHSAMIYGSDRIHHIDVPDADHAEWWRKNDGQPVGVLPGVRQFLRCAGRGHTNRSSHDQAVHPE